MTHTFSFLGSWQDKHNPDWWWLFSVAMVFWGVATIPLVLYWRRRMTAVSPGGAWVGAVLFLVGCVGGILVGFVPDAPTPLIGSWRWTEVHEKAAVSILIGFGLGVPWYGVLLIADRLQRGASSAFNHQLFLAPYVVWGTVFSLAVYFQVKWEFVYAARRAAAETAGRHIGSSWSEAMNTVYSFPLWENLLIYTLSVFILLFTLAISSGTEERG